MKAANHTVQLTMPGGASLMSVFAALRGSGYVIYSKGPRAFEARKPDSLPKPQPTDTKATA